MRAERVALHPFTVAIEIMFLFPDGCPVFDLFNDKPAGAERLVPVRGADGNQNADPLNIKTSFEVLNKDVEFFTPTLTRFGGQFLEYIESQFIVDIVRDTADRFAEIEIANGANK